MIIISLPDGTIGSHALGGDGAGLSYTDGKGVIVATTGTVKVTKLSATLIKGTFSGTAQSIGDSTLITISDGSFSLKKLGL